MGAVRVLGGQCVSGWLLASLPAPAGCPLLPRSLPACLPATACLLVARRWLPCAVASYELIITAQLNPLLSTFGFISSSPIMRVDRCDFSGFKVYPSRGKTYVRGDSKVRCRQSIQQIHPIRPMLSPFHPPTPLARPC